MSQKAINPDPSITPIEALWFKEQFESLHREHLLILDRLDQIQTVVSPALEAQIKKVSAMATSIDRKVPDISPTP